MTTPLSMNSREIAELTGKRHAQVIRDIRKMLEDSSDCFKELAEVSDSQNGKPLPYFEMNTEGVCLMAAKYSENKKVASLLSKLLLNLLENSPNEAISEVKKVFKPKQDKPDKYIYLLKNESNNLLKIGITKNTTERFRTLRNQTGDFLSVLLCVAHEKAREIETEFKKNLSDYNIISEWFEVDEELALKEIGMLINSLKQ